MAVPVFKSQNFENFAIFSKIKIDSRISNNDTIYDPKSLLLNFECPGFFLKKFETEIFNFDSCLS